MSDDATVSRALWLILYDVAQEKEVRYLDWFHHIHIPEKLARPGYTWAAHYEVLGNDGRSAALDGAASADARGFIALFGGRDTRTFLDPSPTQIKPTQTPLTREMMGCRIGAHSLITAEEWRKSQGAQREPDGAFISLTLCDVSGNDEDYGAWCAQALVPSLEPIDGFEMCCKLLSTTNATRHLRLSSFSSLGGARASKQAEAENSWSTRVHDYETHAKGSPYLARRIWPPASPV